MKKPIRFKHLRVEDGLPHSSVFAILQDQYGFMWFTTPNGLVRYDGREFIVHQHNPNDPHSISHNNTFCLIEAHNGELWVGTDPGGVNVYQPRTGQFRAYRKNSQDPNSLINDSIWALLEDQSGQIWIGTREGISRLNPQTGQFTNYSPDPANPAALPAAVVFCLYQDRSGTIWAGTLAGLSQYDPGRDQFITFQHNPDDPHSLSNNNVWAMREDHNGNFWVGTRGGGLNKMDRENQDFTRYQHDPTDPNSLSDDHIWNIYEDRAGTLWIATDKGGLNRFDPTTGQFQAYLHQSGDHNSLSNNDVYGITEDRSGVLWITSRHNGINLLCPACQRFELLNQISAAPKTIIIDNVYAILAESDYLWIGTFGKGLFQYHWQSGETHNFTHSMADASGISHSDIYDLQRGTDGALWVATSGGGLNRLDPQTGQFKTYRYTAQNPNEMLSNFITTIAPGPDGCLWIGTLGFGLGLFDPQQGKMVAEYHHQADQLNSLTEDTIYDLAIDSQGRVWIATARGGISRLDPATEEITPFRADPQQRHTLLSDTVHALYLDFARNRLWAATHYGLSSLDLDTEKWTNFTPNQGLPVSMLTGIQADQNGGIWLSSTGGLIHFLPEEQTFQHFTQPDGLQSNQFNIASSHCGPDGQLYFGGPNGLTYFHPENIGINPYLPPVYLTGFELFNSPVKTGSEILPETIEQTRKITLKSDHAVFSLSFAALNYQLPEKNLYRFKLDCFNTHWSPPKASHSATYTNLNPGKYTFWVQGSNNDGQWNPEAARLEIEILPKWWQTRWFQAGVLLAGSLALGSLIYLRLQQIKNINLQLEKNVQERTQQLTAEISLRHKIEHELREINQALNQKLETITALQTQLREQAARDALTGLNNRHYLTEYIQREFHRAMRANYPIALLLLDLDHFKNINDTYGHPGGDKVLISVANILRQYTRRSDFTCRYGGEEFLVVLPNTSPTDAKKHAEKLRTLVAAIRIHHDSQTIQVTTSIGIAIYPKDGRTPEAVFKNVDAALYEAKLSGRNCIVSYSG